MFLMLVMLSMQVCGCTANKTEGSNKTTASEQAARDNAEVNQEEIEKEQAMAEAQAEADAIEAAHQADDQNISAVERTVFDRPVPYQTGMENWTCTESTVDENGNCRETFQCDEEMKFSWESGNSDGTEAEQGLNNRISQRGYEITSSSRNDQLSELLQRDVYSYEALADDNGYSMYHQGVYISGTDYWYVADYQVMEGVYVDYYDTITGALGGTVLQ